MSGSAQPTPELDSMPDEELARRARERLDAMWSEVRAAGEEVRVGWRPARVAARHPLLAAAVAGAAAVLIARRFRRRAGQQPPPPAAPPEPLARSFARSLLSGLGSAAGRALPAIAAAWLARSGPQR